MSVSAIQVVSNIYALKNQSNLNDRMLFKTMGKDIPFDGGTDDYIYLEGDLTPEDGITIIRHKNNGGSFKSLNGLTAYSLALLNLTSGLTQQQVSDLIGLNLASYVTSGALTGGQLTALSNFQEEQTLKLGVETLGTGTGGMSANLSYFDSRPTQDGGYLSTLSIYASSTGNFKLKVSSPNATTGAWDVTTDVILNASSVGVNNYSVVSATLNPYYIPKGSIVGICTLSGGAGLRFDSASVVGNYNKTSDVSGANIVINTKSYTGSVQFNATIKTGFPDKKTLSRPFRNFIIDESFLGTVQPANWINATSTWTFASAGAVSGTAGSANYLEYELHTCASNIVWRADVLPTSTDSKLLFGRRPTAGGSADEGCLAFVDVATNTFGMYNTWSGSASSLPTVNTSRALVGITLANGRDYRVKLEKAFKVVTLTVTDLISGVSDSIVVDQGVSVISFGTVGYAYGAFYIALATGTGTIKKARAFSKPAYPKTLIFGDSITEGQGALGNQSWGYLAQQAAKDGLLVSGDGGATTNATLRRMQDELSMFPSVTHVIVLTGRNDATTGAGGVTNYQTYMQNIVTAIVNMGKKAIICHCIPTSSSGVQPYINQINTWIRSQGYRTVRFDLAMSTNNDGSTYPASLYYDSSHPNAAGYTAMYNRLLLDVPELFE